MNRGRFLPEWMSVFWLALPLMVLGGLAAAQETSGPTTTSVSPFKTHSIRGRVVWLSEALQRRYGIRSVPEARERTLALESANGPIYPLVEDIRGRGFRRDKRLRDIPVELLVRQYKGSPVVQVIRVFAIRDDGKYELDYWCEVCAITQFELKPCGCCQDMIELRARKTEAGE